MYCTKCGFKNADDNSFCNRCGELLGKNKKIEVPEGRVAAVIPPKADRNNAMNISEKKPSQTIKKIIIAAIAVVLVAAITVLIIFLISQTKPDGETVMADDSSTAETDKDNSQTSELPNDSLEQMDGLGNSQGNIANGGFVAFDEDSGDTYYARSGINKGIYIMAASGAKTLLVGDEAMYLNYFNGIIYYVNLTDNNKIYKYELDGGVKTKLSDDDADYLTYYDDTLYYKNNASDGHVFSLKADGSDRTELNQTPSDSVNVADDGIYYIDIADGSTIKFMDLDGKNVRRISADYQFSKLLYNNSDIYFTAEYQGAEYFGIISQGKTFLGDRFIKNDLQFNVISGQLYFVYPDALLKVNLVKKDEASNPVYCYAMSDQSVLYESEFDGGICGFDANTATLYIYDKTNGKELYSLSHNDSNSPVSYSVMGSSGNLGGEQSNPSPPSAQTYRSAVFTASSASSSTAPANDFTYYPANALDGNLLTCWAEGVEGTGVGEWLEISSNSPQTVSGLKLFNGYHKNDDIFGKNGCPTSVRLDFSDGSYEEFRNLSCVYGAYQDLFFSQRETTYIRITILDANAGSKYEDACISEIIAY